MNIVYSADSKIIKPLFFNINQLLNIASPSNKINIDVFYNSRDYLFPKLANIERQKIKLNKSTYTNLEIKINPIFCDIDPDDTLVGHITSGALLRFFIPYQYGHADKFIYLDVDTEVISPIDILFSSNSYHNYPIYAVRDAIEPMQLKRMKTFSIKQYFNSGVIFFNTQLYLKHLPKSSFLEKLHKFRDDQDFMNVIFKNSIGDLDGCWNAQKLFPFQLYYNSKSTKVCKLKNVKIIHYSGKTKPWNSHIFLFPFIKYRKSYEKHLSQKINVPLLLIVWSNILYFLKIFKFTLLRFNTILKSLVNYSHFCTSCLLVLKLIKFYS